MEPLKILDRLLTWAGLRTTQGKLMRPRKDARIFRPGGVWGDAIGYMRFPDKVHGHKQTFPRPGDILITRMAHGADLVSIFQTVEPCGNPNDMFFADVEPIGRVDEVPIEVRVNIDEA